MKNLTVSIFKEFFSLFFPRICPGCLEPLTAYEKCICTQCQLSMPLTNFHLNANNELWQRLNQQLPLEFAVPMFFFQKDSLVESMIYQLKYKGQQEIGKFLGNWMGSYLKESNIFSEIDGVIPVPLHPKRFKKRGYNQVSCFSKALADKLEAPFVEDYVYRNKNTKQFARFVKSNRWEEVKDAFSVNFESKHKGRHCLLVDDVITTGATLVSCGKTILKQSKGRLSIVTLASRLS